MGQVHVESDILAAGWDIVREEGEGALSRPRVQERLKDRAEARGQGRIGVANRAAQRVVNAIRDELDAKRRSERTAPVDDPTGTALPGGLQAALSRHVQDVEAMVREALSETLRQAELGSQSRLRQIESEAAQLVKRLESALGEARAECEETAGQLDDTEAALVLARAESRELSVLAHSRSDALETLEAETRSQLAAAHVALQGAFEARSRAEQAAHKWELARSAAADELERTRQELARVRKESDERVAALDRAEGRAREAERSLDVARGALATLQEERTVLGARLERALALPAPAARTRRRRTRAASKAE